MTEFEGMTGNERLFAAGLLADWDSAILRRDREAMTAVLTRVGLAIKPPRSMLPCSS
jgi:hypothetical protein